MQISDCFKIGYVLKPHGLKGEVTVALEPDFPGEEPPESVFLEKNQRLIPYFIQSISLRKDKAFVKFEDVDTPEAADMISRSALYLPRTARPPSQRGEFYEDEIIGFEVQDEEVGLLGRVVEVLAAGPNRLLALDHGGKEVLIPLNGPFIVSVNKSKKRITVKLPHGFLEI